MYFSKEEVAMIELNKAGFAVRNKWLIKDVNYKFLPGKCYMICGPNGAGKSTLLKLISLQLRPSEGFIKYNEATVNYGHPEDYAKYRAVLSQQVDISFAMSVYEIIMMGRYPHFKNNPSKEDHRICEEIIISQELQAFKNRNFLTLSGGEKQRVQFARVLAQIYPSTSHKSRILLLDEPISALDIRHQFDFLKQVKSMCDPQTIIIAILHDLNLALNFADEIILIDKGRVFQSGTPSMVLSPENVKSVFNIDSRLHDLGEVNILWPH
ncbi:MAG: ATP-binding cassette domain-containing protein [Bacteroidetes bacterium]|nr:ATP-binding cassette domain-containing protein [Bacteroidota bacterium]